MRADAVSARFVIMTPIYMKQLGWCHQRGYQCMVHLVTARLPHMLIPSGSVFLGLVHRPDNVLVEVNRLDNGPGQPHLPPALHGSLCSLAEGLERDDEKLPLALEYGPATDDYINLYILAFREDDACVAAHTDGARVRRDHWYGGPQSTEGYHGSTWAKLARYQDYAANDED